MSRTIGVIARLDRATQYSAAFVIDPKGRRVLDHPVKPGDDSVLCGSFAGLRKPT
jgi:hypothetical protein